MPFLGNHSIPGMSGPKRLFSRVPSRHCRGSPQRRIRAVRVRHLGRNAQGTGSRAEPLQVMRDSALVERASGHRSPTRSPCMPVESLTEAQVRGGPARPGRASPRGHFAANSAGRTVPAEPEHNGGDPQESRRPSVVSSAAGFRPHRHTDSRQSASSFERADFSRSPRSTLQGRNFVP